MGVSGYRQITIAELTSSWPGSGIVPATTGRHTLSAIAIGNPGEGRNKWFCVGWCFEEKEKCCRYISLCLLTFCSVDMTCQRRKSKKDRLQWEQVPADFP